MEIFVDGGLFEAVAIVGVAYCINYIFLKKYLLIIFSVLSGLAVLAIFFFRQGEIFYFSAAICTLNTTLLIVMLWREKKRGGERPLFDVSALQKEFFGFGRKRRLKGKTTDKPAQLPIT
jgi:hypothetical protein